MALCSLFSFVHVLDPKARRYQELAMRLRRLSSDGNRAYGLLPLDLGQPTKNIVESENYLADPRKVALNRWKNKERGIRDRNGSNAPLMRIHPVAASKQLFPTHPTHQIIVLYLDEIKGFWFAQSRGLTRDLNQSLLNII